MATASQLHDSPETIELVCKGWNDLSPYLVSKIVVIVKESGDWAHSGRKLRSLNKHWRDCINLAITKVHPAINRTITSSDIQSLLKFRNLESIDMWPFIAADHGLPSSILLETSWQDSIGDNEERKRRITNVLQVLTRMPKLTELFLSMDLVEIGESIWTDDDILRLLRAMRGITSLRGSNCFTTTIPRVNIFRSVGWQIKNISHLSLELDDLASFSRLANLDFLRHGFTREYSTPIPTATDIVDICQFMGDVISVSFRLLYPSTLESISKIKQLRHLNLRLCCYGNSNRGMPPDLKPLASLSLLEHLYVSLEPFIEDTVNIEHLERLHKVIEGLRLVSFGVEIFNCDFLPREDLLSGLSTLKCLGYSCSSSPVVLKALPNLQLLDLRNDCSVNTEEFWSYIDRPDSLEGKTFHSLRGLGLPYGLNPKFLPTICNLTNLRALFISSLNIGDGEGLGFIENLTNLKYLSINLNLEITEIPPFSGINFPAQLETLCLDYGEEIPYTEYIHKDWEMIKLRAPHLKITTGVFILWNLYLTLEEPWFKY